MNKNYISVTAQTPEATGHILKNRNILLLTALIAIGIIFEILTHSATNSFLSARSISTIFMQASVIGVIACGMTFIIILTHIDLSVGSAIAFLGGLAAWMMASKPAPVNSPGLEGLDLGLSQGISYGLGLNAGLVIVIMLLLGLMLWGLKGLLQSKTNMPVFIITLGGMMVYRGLAYLIVRREIPVADDNFISRIGTEYLDLNIGWILCGLIIIYTVYRVIKSRNQKLKKWILSMIPPVLAIAIIIFLQMKHPGVSESTRGIAILTFIWAIVALIMNYISQETIFGRHLYATGGNKEAARLCGINVDRVGIIAFFIMGTLMAISSLMYLGQQGTAESSAGNLTELDAIAACVIGGVSLQGGKGTIAGTILGVLIMQALTSGLYQCNVQSGFQMIIKASVLVIVVALDHIIRKDSVK